MHCDPKSSLPLERLVGLVAGSFDGSGFTFTACNFCDRSMPRAGIQIQSLNSKVLTSGHPPFVKHLVTKRLVWLCSTHTNHMAEKFKLWKARISLFEMGKALDMIWYQQDLFELIFSFCWFAT